MPNTIQEQLDVRGFAKVLVVVDRATLSGDTAAAVTPLPGGLERYFVVAPHGQEAALAVSLRPPAARRRASRGRTAVAPAIPQESVLGTIPMIRTYPYLGLLLGTVDRAGLAGLAGDSRVRGVHPAPLLSLIRPVAATMSKRAGGVTWGLTRLGIPDLWNAGFNGKGVLVGHLDTGVDGRHPALKGAVAKFAEFDLQGRQVSGAKAHDTDEHGTHTAGTIAGRSVGTTSFGVAPEARLASAIVIEGGDVIARILAGMNWVVSVNARILSMSLGLRGYTDAFLPVTQILRSQNILPVFAVGNEYAGTSRSPGNYAEALSVGACEKGDAVADFSSSDRFERVRDPIVPDLVAPGVDIISCVPKGRYAQMSGTSMATPHIAGLAAILMQARPEATADQVEKAIFDSCSLPPGVSPDRANRGTPSGPKALFLLTGRAIAVTKPATPKRRRPLRPRAKQTKPKSKSGILRKKPRRRAP